MPLRSSYSKIKVKTTLSQLIINLVLGNIIRKCLKYRQSPNTFIRMTETHLRILMDPNSNLSVIIARWWNYPRWYTKTMVKYKKIRALKTVCPRERLSWNSLYTNYLVPILSRVGGPIILNNQFRLVFSPIKFLSMPQPSVIMKAPQR